MIKEFSYNGYIEKAELVTDWAQLQIFDILWDEQCKVCSLQERFCIWKWGLQNYITSEDKINVKSDYGWEIFPEHKCGCGILVPANTSLIIEKRLYKVINPIEDLAKEIEKEFLDRKLFV